MLSSFNQLFSFLTFLIFLKNAYWISFPCNYLFFLPTDSFHTHFDELFLYVFGILYPRLNFFAYLYPWGHHYFFLLVMVRHLHLAVYPFQYLWIYYLWSVLVNYDKTPEKGKFLKNYFHCVREDIVLWVCLMYLPGSRLILCSLCISSQFPFHAILFYSLIKCLWSFRRVIFSCSYIFIS